MTALFYWLFTVDIIWLNRETPRRNLAVLEYQGH